MEKLKRLFGFTVEEDPLKREVEEMRRAAKAAVKQAEKAEKSAVSRESRRRLFQRGRGKNPEEPGGLVRAAEELESIFSEIAEQL